MAGQKLDPEQHYDLINDANGSHYATPSGQPASASGGAKVHITSSPSGGEIYVDGKFFGNTPSDTTLSAGEHIIKVTIGRKEWSRSIEITAGEISVHADITEQ